MAQAGTQRTPPESETLEVERGKHGNADHKQISHARHGQLGW